MTPDQEERLVLAFEQIATALTGIDDTRKKQFAKQWPERKEVREAVVSRLPSEEDRIRAEHGAGSESLEEWLSTLEEDEAIGPREREFCKRQLAGAQTAGQVPPAGSGPETPEGQA